MITDSRQEWGIGCEVRVGFLRFRIIDIVATPGNYAPDAYILENAKGEPYTFVPHKGLQTGITDEILDYLAARKER
jgi:hypothetical protein